MNSDFFLKPSNQLPLRTVMHEKRSVERFDLQIKTILNVQDETTVDKQQILLSRDISCSGVFLDTEKPLPIGTRVDMNLMLNQLAFGQKESDDKINIITSGKVVRNNSHGMAVQFDELYKITPISASEYPFKLQT